MEQHYYLKNLKTNEIEVLEQKDFFIRFGGKFEHILDSFCVNTYIEKGIEIPYDKKQVIFFMAFIDNWNKYRGKCCDLEAVSYYDLTLEEQKRFLDADNKKQQTQKQEQQRNQATKSVGNGEGSLYKSKTLNCWIFQYFDTSGKRKTLKQRKNEQVNEFKARVTDIKNKLNTGTYVENSRETVISIALQYIENKHINGVTSNRSYKRDLETLQQIEKTCSNFCNIPIQKVTISHIEDAKKEIKKYANSVIDKIWTLLGKTFNIATSPSRKILTYNLMLDETLKKPLSEKITKKVKALTKDEINKLNYILDNEERNHPYRNIVKMQVISGMRIGEVLARSKDDYNRDAQQFDIHNTLTQDEHYHTILGEHTKTYNKRTQIDEGQRYLPLDNNLFNEIIEIIEEQSIKKLINIHNLLFWDYTKNTFITPSEINSWLSRINDKYTITTDSLTTHRLRHTALTYWKEIGIDLSVIQYLAGHVKGSSVTEKVYIDIPYEYITKELNKIV